MRIHDYLEQPESTDQDNFIAKVDDTTDRVRRSLRDFVVGEKVFPRLDDMLTAVGARLDDNRDVGRFIYGSFGSGKSHLLTVLGKMLERDAAVYDLGHAALRRLRATHTWLDRHRTLVVRLNMMGKRSLTSALYEAFNRALPEGAERLVFTDEERIFKLIESDARRHASLETLLEQIVRDGGIPSAAFYHEMRRGDLIARLSLAADLDRWRNHGEQNTRPEDLWVDADTGFDRIARHAQELGYTAVAWVIDELVIWIREKDRATYVKQVNDLSAMVDHNCARVLPFFVAVAVQMDIAETCPEDISEKGFREQLGFISDRFKPALHLEEQDLYEVAAQRVLARRSTLTAAERQTFEAAIDKVFSEQGDSIRALAGNLELPFIKQLYPFHPALLRVLVDVTQALSRNRTAIAALYELLASYPDLAVGQFVPVGALWDVLFDSDNIQTLRQNSRSKMAQNLADTAETWRRIEGKVDAVSGDQKADPKELRQAVRTTLMCQLSDRAYYPDGRPLREGVTVGALLRLNLADIKAITERTGISKLSKLLRGLSGVAPQVLVGTAATEVDPVVQIKTDKIDIEKVLARARDEVDHRHRLAYMRKLLKDQLGLALESTTEVPLTPPNWRGTKRKGLVRLCNVRMLSYGGKDNEFDHGANAFLILVDYPFDEEPGRTRQDDIETLRRAKARSTHWTLAWLPEHLNPTELAALDNAAAVDLIRRDQRRFLEDFPPRDAQEVARALEAYQVGRRAELERAIQRLYFDEGQIHVLKDQLGEFNLQGVDKASTPQRLGTHILDKRYPNHPGFSRLLNNTDLNNLAEWVTRAAQTGQSHDLKAAQMAVVDAIAVPLELVHKGPSSITARRDGRYLRAVLEWIGTRTSFASTELRDLLMAEDGWGFGFTSELADFFLFYLLNVEGFEAQQNNKSMTVSGPTELPDRFQLVKDEVVNAPTWDQARKVAEELFSLRGRADLPTSPEQAKLARDIAGTARTLRGSAVTLRDRLLGILAWAEVPGERSARLGLVKVIIDRLDALLADTANIDRIQRLAGLSQETGYKSLQRLVRNLGDETAALADIESARLAYQYIGGTRGSAEDKTAVVDRLHNILTDGLDTGSLRELVTPWAAEAARRFKALLDDDIGPRPPVQPPVQPPVPPSPPPNARNFVCKDLPRAQATAAITKALEQALADIPGARLTITVTVEPAT
jgi:hypothetical protein